MTDLETRLRQLKVDLEADPALTAAQVRTLGGRRRRTRQAALATVGSVTAALAVVAAVASNGHHPAPALRPTTAPRRRRPIPE